MYFEPTYYLFMIPAFVILIIAQIMVKSRFSKYSKISGKRGLTGAAAASAILRQHGVTDVKIEPCRGKLTDHFDPKAKVIRLSEPVFDSTSIAAIGVACHEAGHALQYNEGYAPIRIRAAMIPLTRFSPYVSIALMAIGYALALFQLVWIGIAFFSLVFILQLVTLPVEFNASRRALESIGQFDFLDDREMKGAKSVLSAAAMTYVAAMLQSLLQLLYFVARASRRR